VVAGIEHACVLPTGKTGRHQPQRLSRAAGQIPAGDAQNAVVAEVVKIAGESLFGIEAVLGQGERAGTAGGPGVDQRGLDDVIAARAAIDETPGVGDDGVHIRPVIEMPGEVGELPLDGLDDGRVDLDGRHVGRAAGQRGQHVAAAAGADDQRARVVAELVGDGRQVIAQEAHLLQVAFEALDGRAGHGVDEQQGVVPQPGLGHGLIPHDRRDAPEERVALRLVDRDPRMDVPALIDDGRLRAAGLVDDDAQPGRGHVAEQ